MGYNEIEVEELKQRMDAGEDLVLLDVREQDEFNLCQIPGAKHIPMNQIPGRLAELPRDRPIICQCHHGGRSAQVANYLASQGYGNVSNLSGGIHAWSQRIDPNVQTY